MYVSRRKKVENFYKIIINIIIIIIFFISIIIIIRSVLISFFFSICSPLNKILYRRLSSAIGQIKNSHDIIHRLKQENQS